MNNQIRLNKYLASVGVAARRKVDEMIEERAIIVNGKVAVLGQKVDPTQDKIEVNGREVVNRKEQLVYILLNKPKGYTSTTAKIKGEKSVLELVKSHVRLYPVGRLDRDSTGLMLLTNDGELAQHLTHPKYHIPKTYEVLILGNVSQDKLSKLKSGVVLDEGKTAPAQVSIIKKMLPHSTLMQFVLYEGRKRQIRRMCAELHLHVLDLKRVGIGSIKLGGMPIGKYRNLTTEEVKLLKSSSPPR